MLKPLKQKLFVDGLSYLLQEIYGLENKVRIPRLYFSNNCNDIIPSTVLSYDAYFVKF